MARAERTTKSQPGGTSVHVNAPMGSRRNRVAKLDTNPPLNNLEVQLAEHAVNLETGATADDSSDDVALAHAAMQAAGAPVQKAPLYRAGNGGGVRGDKAKGEDAEKGGPGSGPQGGIGSEISHAVETARGTMGDQSGKSIGERLQAAARAAVDPAVASYHGPLGVLVRPALGAIAHGIVGKDNEDPSVPGSVGHAEPADPEEYSALYDMQQAVSGMDFEMQVGGAPDEDTAQGVANSNLQDDPDFYRKKWAEFNSSTEGVDKDAEDPRCGDGLCLDLGSGNARKSGHIGVDLYPYDAGTVVHDLTLGLPFPDQSASQIRLVNTLHEMDMDDPKPLLSEIQRVLAPGGQFHYEGPDAIDYPGRSDTNDVGADGAGDKNPSDPIRSQFTKSATPDPAVADDAEPRIGVSQYDDLPSDQLLAMDALGYYWSDAETSGRGNRVHGYPSQGALTVAKSGAGEPRRVSTLAVRHGNHMLFGKRRDNEKWATPGGHCDPGEDHHAGAVRELEEETGIEVGGGQVKPLSDVHKLEDREGKPLHVQPFSVDLKEKPSTSMRSDPDGEVYRWRWIDVSNGIPDDIMDALHTPADRNVLLQALNLGGRVAKSGFAVESSRGDNKTNLTTRLIKIAKISKAKQIVFGVILSPDEFDDEDDIISADEIEKTAHSFLVNSRVVGSLHEGPMDAAVVESYCAPVDFELEDTPYGPQTVKKGAWILGVKINDPEEWQKVEDGEYQGFSVGGFGLRDPLT